MDVKTDNTEPDVPGTPLLGQAVQSVFNGDFESGTLNIGSRFPIINEIPGWIYHGGSISTGLLDPPPTSHIVSEAGNHALMIDSSLTKVTHNRLYIPKGELGFQFDLKVTDPSSNDVLMASMDTMDGKHFDLGTIDLKSVMTSFVHIVLPFTSAVVEGFAATLTLELSAPGFFNVIDTTALIDNFRFLLVDTDADANSDGTVDGKDEQGEDSAPGVLVQVNSDDGDNDGVPNFADGYNRDGTAGNADDAPPTAAQGEAFTTFVITISPGVDFSKANFRIIYDGSDPTGVTTAGSGAEPHLHSGSGLPANLDEAGAGGCQMVRTSSPRPATTSRPLRPVHNTAPATGRSSVSRMRSAPSHSTSKRSGRAPRRRRPTT